MSLTQNDLQQIRSLIREEVHDVIEIAVTPRFRELNEKIDELAGKVEALENDVKEIYGMVSDVQSVVMTDKKFAKLTVEQKLLKLNA